MGSFRQKNSLIQSYSLIVLDVLCILCSYLIAFVIRYRDIFAFGEKDFLLCLLLVLFCFFYSFLLDYNHFIFQRGDFQEIVAVVKYSVSITIFWGFAVFVMREGEAFSRLVFGIFAIINIILTYCAHTIFKKYLYHYYKRSNSSDKVIVVTTKDFLIEVLNDIKEAKEWSYDIIAIAVLDEDYHETCVNGIPVVATGEHFIEKVKQMLMDAAFIYLPHLKKDKLKLIIEDFETMGVTCYQSLGNFNREKNSQSVDNFAGHLVISYEANPVDYRRRFIKRTIDILGSLIGVIFTLILYPFVALAIKLESKGPVIFKQTRIGKNGRRFSIYKFRSMYLDAEERKKNLISQNEMQGLMFKMENDPRITRVGKFIRKTSIDELPQFFNVLKGDMSLVGTRPPTVDEFEKYNLHYRRRLSITPGLTGMWQVSGRSDITDFDEVVKLDLEYIDNWSLTLDLKILLQTVQVVFGRKGSK